MVFTEETGSWVISAGHSGKPGIYALAHQTTSPRPSETVVGRGPTSVALRPEVDGDWKLSSGSPSSGLALSSGGNDEAKRDESDGEYERDDDDPVALETEGNREEDDSSFDDESPSDDASSNDWADDWGSDKSNSV